MSPSPRTRFSPSSMTARIDGRCASRTATVGERAGDATIGPAAPYSHLGPTREVQETGLRRSWAFEAMTGHQAVSPEGHAGQPGAVAVRAAGYTGGLARQTVELLALLYLGVLLLRTFSAEAYVVPTGSMAPTLLGAHRAFRCPDC